MRESMNILIPMAGEGTRLKSFGVPKPLVNVAGSTILEHSIETLKIRGNFVFVTREYAEDKYNKQIESIIQQLPLAKQVKLNTPTRGAVETCLQAKSSINLDEPLIITNCDQYLNWSPEMFLRHCEDYDGVVLTYDSQDPKNSFCSIDNKGNVYAIKEKEVISSNALVGVHYYKKASLFFDAAERLLSDFESKNRPECFVSETYNYLINDGLKVGAFKIKDNGYNSLGTLDDIKVFLAKRNEFESGKPHTLFIDLDGTVLKHAHSYSNISEEQLLNSHVREKLDEWDSLNYKIILVSARKESCRAQTEEILRRNKVPYDQLILGIGGGCRYLINDKLTEDSKDRAIAVNLITDEGFGKVSL